MGFLKPDYGQILVAGEDICGYTEEQMQVVRKKVTMVFQNGALFDSLTVGENVAFPLRERGELIEDQIGQIVNGLLEMVGVAGMADLLPSDLSTGMKRSVAIARALSSQPEAILYDEPTTMVDPLMGRLLGDLIQKLKHQLKLTSIVVTHDMRFAQKLADRVLFLHEAKAHFFGPRPRWIRAKTPSSANSSTWMPSCCPPESRVPCGCPFEPSPPRAKRTRAEAPRVLQSGEDFGIECCLICGRSLWEYRRLCRGPSRERQGSPHRVRNRRRLYRGNPKRGSYIGRFG